ncbi:MAG: DUF4405 domain-containing protein [Candidatus Omnitrophica bacterium]|nr:DUF4405 domain-containing protein [Candidatus Omnitrophota bacterium]
MDKAGLLKVVNPLLFISLVIQALTGVIAALHLFISNPKLFEAIMELHKHNGFVFVALAGTHLYLNWNWVKVQFFKR